MFGIITVFSIFVLAMVACLILSLPVYYALAVAVIAFSALTLKRGFSLRDIWDMIKPRLEEVLIILRIFLYIGIMTALWRSCGTVSYFVYYGIKLITPRLFLIVSFVLTAVLSLALGTAFGVTAISGVILISMARFGGVSELMTAGAVVSGAFFGDRCSSASSSMSLVSVVTDTEPVDNIRLMHKTGLTPFIVTLLMYAVLSFLNPISVIDTSALELFSDNFVLSPILLVPMAIMILLPVSGVPIRLSMGISALSALVLTLTFQHAHIGETLLACITGFSSENADLNALLSGGGLVSMLSASITITLTSILTGIIEGTNLMAGLEPRLHLCAGRIGLFRTTALVSLLISAVLCNQTVAIMLGTQFMEKIYASKGASNQELSIDISNSAVIMATWVPWSISITIPLSMMGVGGGAEIYAFYVFVLPVVYAITKKRFFPHKNGIRA